METRDSEDLEKPQEKSVSGSRAVDEPASVRPEVLSKARMPHADQKAQDKASHTKPVQRNSIFNRAKSMLQILNRIKEKLVYARWIS